MKSTPNTAAKIGLDDGLKAAAGQPRVQFGPTAIDYSLFQPAARALAWKNADPGRKSITDDGTEQTHAISGNLSSYVPIGAYSDTVTVSF